MSKEDRHEQLYSILLEMKEDMGEMKSDLKTVKEQTIKTNGRVNALERFVDTWKGKIAVVTFGLSLIGTAVWQYIKSRMSI